MELIKLGDSPAEFSFEVSYESGDEKGEGVLILNFYEVNAAMVSTGELQSEDAVLTKEYRDRVVAAVRETARPKDLVTKLTDAQLYGKANEMFLLFIRLGEDTGPSQTSRRPTGSSTSPQATTPQQLSPG